MKKLRFFNRFFDLNMAFPCFNFKSSLHIYIPIHRRHLAQEGDAFIRSSVEQTMKSIFARFLKDQSGATAIEYGLIAALISVVAITTLTAVGSKLNDKFTSISGGLN
jgi:pilus assembly protein Flp/PilA